MKKILPIIVVMIAALTIATSASAQSAGTAARNPKAPGMQGKRMEKLQDVVAKLNLTADQRAKIKDHIEKSIQAIKSLRAAAKAGKITKSEAKIKAQEIRKLNQMTIKAMLTPAQAKQFNALIKEAHAKNQAARKR